jgi:hypothetical protein
MEGAEFHGLGFKLLQAFQHSSTARADGTEKVIARFSTRVDFVNHRQVVARGTAPWPKSASCACVVRSAARARWWLHRPLFKRAETGKFKAVLLSDVADALHLFT